LRIQVSGRCGFYDLDIELRLAAISYQLLYFLAGQSSVTVTEAYVTASVEAPACHIAGLLCSGQLVDLCPHDGLAINDAQSGRRL
jgi:hypothetical protein